MILGTQTLDTLLILATDVNPSTAGGVAAPIGSFGSATDGSGFFVKNGALDTDWIQVITSSVLPTTYAVGDTLYADTTTTLARLADVATGNALISGGVGIAPSYGKIGLTTHVSGILAGTNGGTGVNNGAFTITLAGDLITSGAFQTTITVTAITGITLPTSGTLYGTKTGSITSAQLLNSLTNPTGTGVAVFGTAPTFTTSITTPLIYGGTAVGSGISYTSTTGVGTTTGAAHTFAGGTNGATNIATMYNDGQFLVGTTTRNPGALGITRIGQGTSTIDIGEVTAGLGAIWLTQSTPSTTNYAIKGSSASTTTLNGSTTVVLAIANATKFSLTAANFAYTPALSSSTIPTAWVMTSAAHTGLTASTEVIDQNWNNARIVQHATGTLTLQRSHVIQAPTYSYVAASATTDMATFAVTGAPLSGLNNTPTNTHAILIQAGAVNSTGTAPTNSYGLTANAQTGATNNYAAQFLGGLGVLMTDINLVLTATTGTKIATATSQKLGFWNATPIIQPASANQAVLINSTTGTFDGTLVDVGVVFSQANINNNFTDVFTLLDAMRTAMVNSGLMKGAA